MTDNLINIAGDANDVNYRYKMPPLVIKIEGRGNGIKTVLMNIVDVSKFLKTQPEYATKFFGIELGALSKFDGERAVGIVNGAHQVRDLQEHLKKFIHEFILCPKCHIPELQMKVHPTKSILMSRCLACGWKGRLPTTHKLTTYIVSHPPKAKKAVASEDVPTKKKTKNISTTEMKEDFDGLGGANDEIWSVDVSEEAVANRKLKEMETLAISDKPKKKLAEGDGPSTILRNFITDGNRTIDEIMDEICRIQLARTLDDQAKIKVLFEALFNFDDSKQIIKSIKDNAKLLSYFTTSSKDVQIFFQCFEEMVAVRNPDKLLAKTPILLKELYDNEVVNEEQILQWYDTPPDESWLVNKDEATDVREKAKIFVEWLRNAEEDGEDEEDE